MRRREFITLAGSAAAAWPLAALAQQPRVYRVGVILQGGPYYAAIDGLRDGLKELGREEGKHFVLHVRDIKGDLKAAEAAAKSLEAEKVDLIYALATSVTLATKRATKKVPIMYYGGTNPVTLGLIESWRKPGGRITGIYGHATDLAGKRLQLLAELIPNLGNVVTFYSPDNPTSLVTIRIARKAAQQLKINFIERPVTSVEALRSGLHALQPGEADAFLYAGDAMVAGQAKLIINVARSKKLPTMFADREHVALGALASYGVSYYAVGRLSARNVNRILLGSDPGGLPIEQMETLHLAINLRTAKAFGLTIPTSILVRAEVIE